MNRVAALGLFFVFFFSPAPLWGGTSAIPRLNIAAYPDFYLAAGMSKILSSASLRVDAESAVDVEEALRLLHEGEAYVCILDSRDYAGKNVPFLRALAVAEIWVVQIYAARGVHSLSDLKGKKVAVSTSQNFAELAEAVFQAAGLDMGKDVRTELLNDCKKALDNGRVDAALWIGKMIISAESFPPGSTHLLDVPSAVGAGVSRRFPAFFPYALPPYTAVSGHFISAAGPGQGESVNTLAVPSAVIVAHERLDPELAYALTKTLLEGRRAFSSEKGDMALGMLERENVRMLRMPLHPGAERYYKGHNHCPFVPLVPFGMREGNIRP